MKTRHMLRTKFNQKYLWLKNINVLNNTCNFLQNTLLLCSKFRVPNFISKIKFSNFFIFNVLRTFVLYVPHSCHFKFRFIIKKLLTKSTFLDNWRLGNSFLLLILWQIFIHNLNFFSRNTLQNFFYGILK